jgi:hypothetical protein
MSEFTARQVTRSHTLRLNGRPDDVFGLFDPIGEKKWSKDWNPVMIFPTSQVRQGGVFVTRNNVGTETIWAITTLDQNSRNIVYTTVTPNLKVNLIQINCEPDGVNHTKARVTYTITALSEKGNQYVGSFSSEYYRKWIMHWGKAINHYLRSGHQLQHH